MNIGESNFELTSFRQEENKNNNHNAVRLFKKNESLFNEKFGIEDSQRIFKIQ